MSEPAYDHKYSDRDVRENPDLRHLALDYIERYGGSFEPLLRIKQFLSQCDEEEVLSTAQVRLILNCMRHDAAVAADMPAPKFPYIVAKRPQRDAVVIPIQRDRRSGRWETVDQPCDDKEPHGSHTEAREIGGKAYRCPGVSWPINRRYSVTTRSRLKGVSYAVTKSGSLVHKITGEARLTWRPYPHDWGFVDHPVSVSVKTCCKNPSWIDGGHLFKDEPVHLYADEVFAKERCKRCFTVTELREGPPPARLGIPQVIFQPPES